MVPARRTSRAPEPRSLANPDAQVFCWRAATNGQAREGVGALAPTPLPTSEQSRRCASAQCRGAGTGHRGLTSNRRLQRGSLFSPPMMPRGQRVNGRDDGKLVSVLVTVRCPMQTWPIQDAKARFSEFLETCLAEGPQMVTKRGSEAAVLVPVDEWRRLKAAARPSLKQLLLSDQGRADLTLPSRGNARRRAPVPAR